ncbi:hypothetical protein CQW32_01745 [Pseudomonas putida]|nr:hypothetical protein CQW32_01745 [Pseudomonas putida]
MHGKVALAKPFSEERLHLSLQVEGIAGVVRWNVAAWGPVGAARESGLALRKGRKAPPAMSAAKLQSWGRSAPLSRRKAAPTKSNRAPQEGPWLASYF